MRAEPCAECGKCEPLQPHPYLAIASGKPATFAPLMVCRECFPARFSMTALDGNEKARGNETALAGCSLKTAGKLTPQMDLFASAVHP